MRKHQRTSSADAKVTEEGRGKVSAGTRAEIPLQPIEKTVIMKLVLLQLMKSTVEQISTLQAHGEHQTRA